MNYALGALNRSHEMIEFHMNFVINLRLINRQHQPFKVRQHGESYFIVARNERGNCV